MNQIHQTLTRARQLLSDLNDHASRLSRVEGELSRIFDEYYEYPWHRETYPEEYREDMRKAEGLRRERDQAKAKIPLMQKELSALAEFLRSQTAAAPYETEHIAEVLDAYDKSGRAYLARVREQAVQTSIANARAEWNRTRSPAARQRFMAVLTEHQKWNDLLPLALEDVRNAPNDRRARQVLASVYEHLGKRDDLLTLLKQDLASTPGNAALRKQIAELLVRMARYDEAIDHLQQDIAAPKPEPWAADLMAQALEGAKKTDALIHFLRGQAKSDPANARWRQKLGTVLEQERRWDELIVFLRDQVKSHPTEFQWRQKLYSVLEQDQRWNDLIPLYEQDISRNPGDPKLRERVAMFYRKGGRLTEYVDKYLMPAAKRAPNNFALKQTVVETLLEAHRDSDALLYIQEELAANPSGSSLLTQFTVLLVKQRRSDLVETLACHYLPPGKSQTNAYKEVARGCFQSSDLENAVAFLDRMVQRFPDNPDIKDLPVTFLVETLDSPSSTTRAAALKELYGRHDRVRAVEPLNDLLRATRDSNVRDEIPTALVIIQQAEALPILETALNSNFIALRVETAKALGALGDKRGVQLLRHRLKVEQDASVVAAIKDALRQIDPKAKIAPAFKTELVLTALIFGGMLGAALGWVQLWKISPASPPVEMVMASALAGALVIGFPAGLWRAEASVNRGGISAFIVGVMMGAIAGAIVAFIELALSRWGLPSLTLLDDSITLIVAAVTVAILSVTAVIAFNTGRWWIPPATALLLVTAVVLPTSDWTGFLANLNLSGQARQVAQLDQASSNAQEEALGMPIDATVAAGTPTPPPPALPAGIPADAQSAKVISVLGGNSLQVQLIDRVATVSYAEVTAPAVGEAGAGAAARFGESLLLDQWVWLETPGPAQSGTDIAAYVWLADGTLANLRLVTLGYALPDLSRPGDGLASQLKRAATEAWDGRAGFWAGGADVAPWAAVVVDVANIRQGPGTDRPVVAQAVRGDIFVINGHNANGDWLQIQASDAVTAWIFAELAQTTTPISSLPVVLP